MVGKCFSVYHGNKEATVQGHHFQEKYDIREIVIIIIDNILLLDCFFFVCFDHTFDHWKERPALKKIMTMVIYKISLADHMIVCCFYDSVVYYLIWYEW